jgi:hypothetical protein
MFVDNHKVPAFFTTFVLSPLLLVQILVQQYVAFLNRSAEALSGGPKFDSNGTRLGLLPLLDINQDARRSGQGSGPSLAATRRTSAPSQGTTRAVDEESQAAKMKLPSC